VAELWDSHSNSATGWMIQGSNAGRVTNLSHLQNVQTDSGDHPAFSSVGISGSFLRDEVAGA